MSDRRDDVWLASGTAWTRFLGQGRAAGPGAEEQALLALARGPRSRDVPVELIQLALELTRMAEGLDAAGRRALFFLVLSTFVAVRQGSTRIPVGPELTDILTSLGEEPMAAGALVDAIQALLVEGRARAIVGGPTDFRPLVFDGRHIYLQRMFRDEDRFVEALSRRRARGPFPIEPGALEAALDDVVQRPPMTRDGPLELSDEQLEAIRRAVRSPLTVISGGPGTGKTSIVVSIVRVLVRLGLGPETFALAAPTGKAANRLGESIEKSLKTVVSPSEHDRALMAHRPEPRTLHRMLGYSPKRDRFLHHENSPLSERAVIIDESSMIDLFSMDRLTRAVRLDARLVLLGDAEQLPSVDAGAVLRDMTSAEAVDASPGSSFAVTLHKSFRMNPQDPAGRNILSVARALKTGRISMAERESPGDELIAVRRGVDRVRAFGVELLEASGREAETVREQYLRHYYGSHFSEHEEYTRLASRTYTHDEGQLDPADQLDLDRLFQHLGRFKILCITRGQSKGTGAQAVNLFLHELAARDAVTSGADARRLSEAGGYLPGEPVIAVENDYERKLFNGDQGVVLDVAGPDGRTSRMAVFSIEGHYSAFYIESVMDLLARAHALTVHKAQGSEFDQVVIVLPAHDVPIFTRELLYTALTRSRRSAVIVGERAMLERGAERKVLRWSGVSERLRRAGS